MPKDTFMMAKLYLHDLLSYSEKLLKGI